MDGRENKHIGEKLKQQRKHSGIKQRILAEKLRVSASYISKLENGKIAITLLLFLEYCSIVDSSPIDIIASITDYFL